MSHWETILQALDRPAWVWSPEGEVLATNALLDALIAGAEPQHWAAVSWRAEAAAALRSDPDTPLERSLTLANGHPKRACRLSAIKAGDALQAILVLCAPEPLGDAAGDWVAECDSNLLAACAAGEVGLWTLDRKTDILQGTPNWFAIMGLEPRKDGIALSEIVALIHPDDLRDGGPDFPALLAGEIDRVSFDHRFMRPDGGCIWVNLSAQLRRRDDLGLPPLICGATTDISARKAHQERLETALDEAREARREARETAELFRLAAACGEIGPFSFCPETGEGWMMDETFQMMGYEPGAFHPDVEARHSLIHPDDREYALPALKRVLSGETDIYEKAVRHRHQDGAYHWYRTVGQVVDRSEEGLPPLVIGATSRIDRQKENERRLAEALADAYMARDRLNRLADNAPIALYEVCHRPDGSIELPYFTAKMPDFFGVTEEDLRADPLSPMRHMLPEDLENLRKQIDAAHTSSTPVEVQVRVQHPRRGLIAVLIASIPHRQPDGSILSYASVSDVTHRLEAEVKFAKAAEVERGAHERLNQLTENSPAGLYEFRAEPGGSLRMSYFNPNLTKLFGVTADALAEDGQMFFAHVDPEVRTILLDQIESSSKHLTVFEAQYPIDHPERGQVWLLSRAKPTRSPDGTTVWHGTTFDITERKQAEERVAQAALAVQTAHSRLNKLTENCPVALFEHRLYPDGEAEFTYFNALLAVLLGVPAEELRRNSLAAYANVPASDASAVLAAASSSAKTLEPYEVQYTVDHPKRGTVWLLTNAVPQQEPDGTVVWYGSTFDITERLEMENQTAQAARQLRDTHARLSSIANTAPVGLCEASNPEVGPPGLVYTSERFDDIFGISSGSPREKYVAVISRMHPEDRGLTLRKANHARTAQTAWAHRFRVTHPKRGERWISVNAQPFEREDGTRGHVAAYVDVTNDVLREAELRRAHALAEEMRRENEHQALHDPLTGLPNRRFFDQMLAERFEMAQQSGSAQQISLIRIDGDRFKYINDTFGHEAGDAVLQRIGEILQENTRGQDFPARIGGDEFSVLLSADAEEADAAGFVKRIQTALAEPLIFDNRRCLIQASFGLASVLGPKETATDLLAFADAALYRAKEQGRNRMEIFSADLREDILDTRRLASELQDALARDEFEPFFQPQIDIEQGTLTGVETLLRWRHPERGILSPGDFMTVAEQLRIVPDLDRIMVDKAGESLARLRDKGLLIPKISFNVSSGRMRDDDVVASARRLIDRGIQVTFELLESTLLEEESDVFHFHLDLLRDAGIAIEIDDFGSGHASIIALMKIAPSALKIDRRIIAPVAEERRARKLVRAIIEIAETLNITTVAEGVEQAEQVAVLRDLGCNILQGYYFSRPVDEAAIEQLLVAPPWAGYLDPTRRVKA